MNEHIKSLLAQAHLEALDIKDTNEIAERFAYLVIGECMSICQSVADDALVQKKSGFLTDNGKTLYEGVWGGAKNCLGHIGNHFGVKNG